MGRTPEVSSVVPVLLLPPYKPSGIHITEDHAKLGRLVTLLRGRYKTMQQLSKRLTRVEPAVCALASAFVTPHVISLDHAIYAMALFLTALGDDPYYMQERVDARLLQQVMFGIGNKLLQTRRARL